MRESGSGTSVLGDPLQSTAQRLLPSDRLLIALIFLVPIMKPAVRPPVIAADLLFVLLVLVLAAETMLGLRRLYWIPAFPPLLGYVACLALSLLATSDLGLSLFKLATEFYLIGLAAVTGFLVDDRRKLRFALLAWLAAAAVVSLDGLLSLAAFAIGWPKWLVDYSGFGFDSLPPGPYPRLALTFFNFNMACNYLTASLGVAFVCRKLGYIRRTSFLLIVAGLAIASLSTISPGLGGMALLGGYLIWIDRGGFAPRARRAAVSLGVVAAALFVVALALTPFRHSTATFQIDLPGGVTLYPAPRLLIWIAAFKQFAAHPLVGIGIGIDPVHVGFQSPTGFQLLTDAHNIFLSIAAQCGVVGLIGLAAVVYLAIASKPSLRIASAEALSGAALCATFLNVLLYQGIGGSFEDTRHIWLLLGLLIGSARAFRMPDQDIA
ncbi:MAG TPA: O-antigen ligase family protein [Sphingomicrobium sp.]|nr:O-antigen ligase family protein [Sphingomicrobium sp.]